MKSYQQVMNHNTKNLTRRREGKQGCFSGDETIKRVERDDFYAWQLAEIFQ
jgi:hypothetical protein